MVTLLATRNACWACAKGCYHKRPGKFVTAILEAEESYGEASERFGIGKPQSYEWREG